MKQQLRAAAIVGTGSYVPERILSNADLEKMVDTSDEWISTRTGIRERRLAGEGMATSDMAVEAAKRAMENAKIRPEDVDLLIIATITPDKLLPAAACYVQYKLGLRQIPCFDLVAACSGFIYGIVAGSSFIRAGVSTTALGSFIPMASSSRTTSRTCSRSSWPNCGSSTSLARAFIELSKYCGSTVK